MATSGRETPRRYSIAEARHHLARIVHAVEQGQPVELTRRGKPVAALVSMADYERAGKHEKSFWDAMTQWRQNTDLEELDVDGWLEGIRDETIGRHFSW